MRRKFILLIACVLLVATSFAQTSGTCGPNLTWTFEESTGTLTINGEGMMGNFAPFAPWSQFATQITDIIIEDGVIYISAGAFSGCTGLTSITLPNSEISIGYGAFSGCIGLTSIMIPNRLQVFNRVLFTVVQI